LSNERAKKIRVPKSLIEASWGTFFQDQSIELIDGNLAIENTDDNSFQIIDTFLPDNILLDNENVHTLLKSYFESGKDFDLINNFSSKNKDLYSIKIHDYLNLGYFVDAIVVEAYKNGFSYNQIRVFLNSLLFNSFQAMHTEQDLSPIEVSFGCNDTGFALQISLRANQFKFDRALYLVSNFVDVTEYTKTSQITISALWFKSAELTNLHLYFNKNQISFKGTNLENLQIVPVFENEAGVYDPKLEQGKTKIFIAGEKNGAEDRVHIKGSRVDLGDDVFRIKGTPDKVANGDMRVLSTAGSPLEQQMYRMKDLLYKMKEKLHNQKISFETTLSERKSDEGLLLRIAEIENENLKIIEEKKYVMTRLQLANRKLQILENNLEKTEVNVRFNPDQENQIELLKQEKQTLEEKLNSNANVPQEMAAKNLEFQKLVEIKVLYENKMKEQLSLIKNLDSRVKLQATQLDGALKKLSGKAAIAVVGSKSNENHAKQLEHASNRVAEVTKEVNDKKKEIIMVKQENAKLTGRIFELEKKLILYEKKSA
jgi:hypothetical protein